MQALSRFRAVSRFRPRPSLAARVAPAGLLASLALALAAGPAGAAQAPTPSPAKSCPGFSVLHNDRIGPAVFPAGSYRITLEDSSLTCKSGGELFARFLEDFDGILPTPWKVAPEASGRSSFTRGALPGFSVTLTKAAGGEEEGATNPDLGTLCPGTFMVQSSTVIKPLRFTKGRFLIYLPSGSALTCKGASSLFTSFLSATPNLPKPWKLMSQTATFYQPSSPVRTAFRIESTAGAGRR